RTRRIPWLQVAGDTVDRGAGVGTDGPGAGRRRTKEVGHLPRSRGGGRDAARSVNAANHHRRHRRGDGDDGVQEAEDDLEAWRRQGVAAGNGAAVVSLRFRRPEPWRGADDGRPHGRDERAAAKYVESEGFLAAEADADRRRPYVQFRQPAD